MRKVILTLLLALLTPLAVSAQTTATWSLLWDLPAASDNVTQYVRQIDSNALETFTYAQACVNPATGVPWFSSDTGMPSCYMLIVGTDGEHIIKLAAQNANGQSPFVEVKTSMIYPAPVPQPVPSTTSPDNTLIPPAAQIVDTMGAVWTIGAPNLILRNGAQAGSGLGTEICWVNSTVNVLGIDNQWWRWNGGGWTAVGTTRPGCVTTPSPTPPPPLVVSCPADFSVPLKEAKPQAVTWTIAPPTGGATGSPVTVTSAPASGSLLFTGVTTVKVLATNTVGQQSSCQFNITVTYTPPNWSCSIAQQVKTYSNGDKQVVIRCPTTFPGRQNETVTVSRP